MITEKDVVDLLEAYSKSYMNKKTQFAIFVNGKHVFIGKAKAYLTANKAKSMILNRFGRQIHPYNGSKQTRKDIELIVDRLIEKKVIEIKQIL